MITTPPLKDLREKIDLLDDQILSLISRRAKIAQEVAKAKQGESTYRPGREAQILSRMAAQNASPLPAEAVQGIFREIIAACRQLQETTTIAYLGPAGTYSEAAARLHFGSTSTLVPQPNLAEVFATAEKGTTRLGVVPIENSIEGTVNPTLDLLRQTPLQVVGEIMLPIHHQLLTKAKKLEEITEVSAHPQALAQCQRWLAHNLPKATLHEVSSNTEGARLATENPHTAAIAGKSAAGLYHLEILATNIEDQSTNTTRFLVLGGATPAHKGHDKTSLLAITPNQPGALHHLLDCLARHDINMTKLEARPSRENNWDYVFYIDIQGHQDDPSVQLALRDLRKTATFIKILGSYPAAKA